MKKTKTKKKPAELEAYELVYNFFNDKEKANLWLSTPNPMLGNIIPQTLIQIGKGEKLLKIIKELLDENKSHNKKDF